MTGAVVITRPLAQAAPLAQRVAALGREVEILPLLEIAPLADQAQLLAALARLDQYAMVAFVSPNAVDAAFAHIRQWPAGVTAAVVGEGSRAALAAHGVADIISPADSAHSDSEHLLQTLDLAALKGKPVLIIRGESGRELMADGLRDAGAVVDVAPAYRRSLPALTPELAARLKRLLTQQNDWIITSSEALRGLCDLLAKVDLQHPNAMQHNSVVAMQQQHLIVPHARIAETANNLGFSKLTLTGSGDERLLAALQSRL
ncbi:uroporphyrinogen-III synthase [Duganella sp. sic0402]|uniref:uroporphyrinogen-III synthase n=1 Tax=Duganella sp. sic0402 TaxID=2854786 RepID=UPI001C4977E1|nr:uroporphyrinogen-III synthase [Duganella sp. sic0402]MBV7536566.1 uroporphyrinogen-III synthase [Duganella sp. sic0402]